MYMYMYIYIRTYIYVLNVVVYIPIDPKYRNQANKLGNSFLTETTCSKNRCNQDTGKWKFHEIPSATGGN